MSFRRTLLRQFSLANDAYITAKVTVYTVDPDTNERTDTLATLYSELSGTATVQNPYTLDGFGKFLAPVYHDQAVVCVVNESQLGTHETGIIRPQAAGWRGDWVLGEEYLPGEIARGQGTENLYVCAIEHTSTNWAADLAAGLWELVLDVDVAAAAAASATASASTATSAASAASTSATSAAASATAAAQRARVEESGSQTFALGDANTYQRYTGSGGHTWTIPPNSSVAFATDIEIDGFNATANELALVAGTGVTVNGVVAGNISIPAYSGFSFKKVAADTWDYSGYAADAWEV